MLTSLRPEKFDDFVGQTKLKQTLNVIIQSAKKRKKPVDHILLHGKPGIGKTSLATIIANELGARIKYAQGPTLEKKADILSLMGSISKGDVIFVDEIHGINKNVEELIYSALEDGLIDIVIGTEGDSKIVRMKLPPFTFIGATTKLGKISAPLKDRFGIVGKLLPYEDKEIEAILKNSLKFLKWKASKEAIELIASYSKQTPRIANTLLKRVIDFAIVDENKSIDVSIVQKTFESLGIYKYGLNDQHIEYLKCLNEIFEDRSGSLDSISGIINESKENIEVDIEPILISKGLITKSSRGRKITNKGVEYMTTYNFKL